VRRGARGATKRVVFVLHDGLATDLDAMVREREVVQRRRGTGNEDEVGGGG